MYIKENGYPPTIREMMTGMGYKSTATIASRLMSLEQHGLIKTKFDSSRAIKVMGYRFVKEKTDHACKQ